ncbi:MAG: CPBP family intramembrane metalloprotease [Bacteroidaceae bacterium]|nr:CPBP family intramembrane metalloprotease [Bacteroidaceae bacterium]
MAKLLAKTLGLLLLFVIVQQFVGTLIATSLYMSQSGIIDEVTANPSLTSDAQWLTEFSQQMLQDPEFLLLNVGIGLAVSSLLYIFIMLVTRWAHRGSHRTTWQSILWALLFAVPVIVVGNVLTELSGIEDMMAGVIERASHTTWGVLSIAVLGPIAEEVCYRAGIMGLFIKAARDTGNVRLIITGLLIQAVLFAGIHVNPVQVIFAMFMGLLLGWVYLRTGSLWPCIALHIANNSTAVAMSRFCPEVDSLIAQFGGPIPTACICLVCLWIIYLLLTRFQYIAPSE